MASEKDLWLDVEIDKNNVEGGMLEVLKVVRPGWDLRKENIVLRSLAQVCCCNTPYACYPRPKDDVTNTSGDVIPKDAVVFRLCYMTMDARLPKRSQDIHTMLDSVGLSPKILRHFRNGTCMEFVHGKLLDSPKGALMKDPEIMDKVAKGLAKLHSKKIYELARSRNVHENLIGRYHQHEEQLIFALDKMEKPEKYRNAFPNMSYKELNHEIDFVHRQALKLNPEKAFCQLDFGPQNMFLMPNGEITFIDFDWAAISYVPFDISSLLLWFTEFQNPKEEDIPGDDYVKQFCRFYLKHRQDFDPEITWDEDYVQLLVHQIRVFLLQSWLRWAHVGMLLIAHCGMGEACLSISNFYWELYRKRRDEVVRNAGLDPDNWYAKIRI